MTTPLIGPTPPNLTSPTQTSRSQAVAYYAGLLDAQYGAEIGKSYQGYANAHPNETAYQALQNWANTLAASLGPNLSKVIQQFAKDAGKSTGQIAVGTGIGAEQVTRDANPLAGIEAFFASLTDVKTWRSLGWLLLGVGLIIAGIVLFLKKQDVLPDVVPVPV